MTFSLRIESLDNKTCAIILNGKLHCEASFPLQEEWFIQAIYAALKSQGYPTSAFLTRQGVSIYKIEELRARAAAKKTPKTSTEVLTLEDLDL